MYIAHKTEDGKNQLISEHLENVGKLAKEYVQEDFKSLAYVTGKMHDLGKYSSIFQNKINGDMSIKVEHAICGAKEVDQLFKNCFTPLMKYCIAGHHTGLPDGGCDGDGEDTSTLSGRMKRKCEDYSIYKTEIDIKEPNIEILCKYISNYIQEAGKHKRNSDEEKIIMQNAVELYAFFTRYIFSSITDADFIDTERFFNPEYERGIQGDFSRALEQLNTYMMRFKADTPVRRVRKNLQNQAIINAKNAGNISILNMPTGSGKTLCSIKIALEMAIREKKKHIIYVIPYTSIIEQTANEFSNIFGGSLYVLQHHSNYIIDEEGDENRTTAQKLNRTCENWDASLIVTTSVQFFESVYHYKSSKLRKLHNLTDAIIVFDEVHMIPTECLQACIRAAGYITKYLNSKVIFLSATMPDYSTMFRKYIPNTDITELITDKTEYGVFNNCQYINMGSTSFDNVVIKASEYRSSLIVVNRRNDARKIYNMINGKKYHLSTYMTPADRTEIIAKIKEQIGKEQITVVSTSLIEAGVDLDFEAVFRQLAGLDSIIQSAGRCNREGLRDNGYVFIFEPEDYKVQLDLQPRIIATRGIVNRTKDIASKDSIEYYYREIFEYKSDEINSNSIAIDEGGKIRAINHLPFKSYSEKFEYIRSETVAIVIPNENNQKIIESLEYGGKSVMRKLQPYSVSVYRYELDIIIKLGILKCINGVYVLTNGNYYNKELGLDYLSTHDDYYFV